MVLVEFKTGDRSGMIVLGMRLMGLGQIGLVIRAFVGYIGLGYMVGLGIGAI